MELLIGNNILVYIISFTTSIISATLVSFLILRDEVKVLPIKPVSAVFFTMVVAVFLSIFTERFTSDYLKDQRVLYFLWAFVEEIAKFIPIYFIILRKIFLKPSAIVAYSIITAIGFAVFENTLFFIQPLITGNIYESIAIINYRTLGATLIHIISSTVLALFVISSIKRNNKILWIGLGLICATTIHALWNLLSMDNNFHVFSNTLIILWLIFLVYILIVEKFISLLDQKKYSWKSVSKKIGGTLLLILITTYAVHVVQENFPKYTQSDIKYWTDRLTEIESVRPSWNILVNPKNKTDFDKINSLIEFIAQDTRTILDSMLEGKAIDQEQFRAKHEQLTREFNALADRINLNN